MFVPGCGIRRWFRRIILGEQNRRVLDVPARQRPQHQVRLSSQGMWEVHRNDARNCPEFALVINLNSAASSPREFAGKQGAEGLILLYSRSQRERRSNQHNPISARGFRPALLLRAEPTAIESILHRLTFGDSTAANGVRNCPHAGRSVIGH